MQIVFNNTDKKNPSIPQINYTKANAKLQLKIVNAEPNMYFNISVLDH